MAERAGTELESVRRLVEVRRGDPLNGDLYLARAAELLKPQLSEDAFNALRNTEASVGGINRDSQLALLRGEWARVKDLAERAASLRRASAARKAEVELAEQIYGAPEIAIDPFSPGFAELFVGSPEALARRRDDLVRAFAALEGLDAPWRKLYAERRAHFAALVLTVAEEVGSASTAIDADRARREALAALDKGDVDGVLRMAQTMLERGESPTAAATGTKAEARVGASLPPFPDAAVARARPLGLAHEQRVPDVEASQHLRAVAWSPLFPADEGAEASSRRVTAPASIAGAPQSARDLVDQFAIHPYVNSLGVRYLPPLESEWVLIEDFAEDAQVPDRSPLLEALGLARRRALSRLQIERAVRERGPALLESLGLDAPGYLVVCVPVDVYVSLGARRGWGGQQQWTHFDGYEVLRDGTLRALVGGDARFGGLFDVCSIAREDGREGVVARFAVVRRERMRTSRA
jgi:hypothetical protein